MNIKLNKRYIALLLLASTGFYLFGASHQEAKITEQQNKSLQYVKATTQSFQINEARYLAFQLLEPKQFACLDFVLTKESHWNPKAKNPTSSARGIGQLLNQTYKNIGMKHSDDSRAQLIATLAYISRWYGSAGPCGAKAHWLKKNWY
jgi:membrane-bound lytic murein transglycosylase MltF